MTPRELCVRHGVVSGVAGVLAAALLAGGVAAAADAEGQQEPVQGRYIVVLEAPDAGRVIAEHSAQQGVDRHHVYRHTLRGYSATMTDKAVDEVRDDPRVAYVERDRRVTVASHTCWHRGRRGGDSVCRDGDVSGTVTDAETGDAVGGATVTVEGSGRSDTTDSSGDYFISDVSGGTYTATADADGYEAESTSITVDGDTTADFALPPQPSDDCQPDRRRGGGDSVCQDGDVSGTVTDAETGDAVGGATVTVEGSGRSDTTDSSGDYFISDVSGGKYTATANADGYEAESQEITVDGDTTVDFALSPQPADNQTVPWGVSRVGAPSAHDSARTGSGVRTYVLDTGIDVDHPDLNVAGGYAAQPCSGSGCDAPWDDDNGHGTHVAGTVAALDNNSGVVGVAPETSLWAVKVLGQDGVGSLSDVIEGIDWIAGQTGSSRRRTRAGDNAAVANMSFAARGLRKQGECTSSGFVGEDSFHQAICNASNEGVVFTAAAGNSGADAETTVPAAYDDAVLAVSATNDSDDWPTFSNWGNDAAGWTTNTSAPVALAAPGVDILSTQLGGGTTTASGTSMAAPHVAGAAALFLQASPQPADHSAFTRTRARLLDSAESTEAWSNTSGNPHDEGFLNVR